MTAAAIVGLATIGVAAPASATGSDCQEVTRAVALGPGLPADQTIGGTLCTPAAYHGAKTIDILVHGATYNRAYWDFPINQPLYSYTARTLIAGRATFAYDRLGTGQSSRPASALVTLDADAYVLHQLIDWARNTQDFRKIDIVSHSVGSIVGMAETATYNDADRLVLTGALHTTGPGSEAAITNLYPAFLDPQFSASAPDPGYLTTVPGSRGTLFYSALSSPAVIAYDEAHKDVASAPQFVEGVTLTAAPAPVNISQNIHIPVLTIVGAQDFLFCVGGPVDCNSDAALQASEAAYFTGAPNITAKGVPSTGHDLTLHFSAGLSFAQINAWINTH